MDNSVKAMFWTHSKDNKESKDIICQLCPHYCKIVDGAVGKCGVRTNVNGTLMASSYGKVTSIALDPIEKKPLYEFYPGSTIVSIGSVGCNLHCPFCQNHSISLEYKNITAESLHADFQHTEYLTPETIVEVAKQSIPDKNIGIAYTYNEPLIGYEFILDCFKLIRRAGLKNVLVTNGYINPEPLKEILPYIDAMNIDIKGNKKGTYDVVGGTPEPVKKTIELATASCHVEVTTLVIPGENEDEIEGIAQWLAQVDPKIPYHLSRFFPRYKYKEKNPTTIETMYKVRDVAKRYLKNVYLGNV